MSDIEATLVEFRSKLGNSILYPSHWIPNDKETAFSISAPNGQAVISCLTFATEGSGSLVDFGRRLVQELTSVEPTEWESCQVGNCRALKWQTNIENPDATSHWLVYVLQCGQCYHALLVELNEIVMALNWQFYEKLIETFNGNSGNSQDE